MNDSVQTGKTELGDMILRTLCPSLTSSIYFSVVDRGSFDRIHLNPEERALVSSLSIARQEEFSSGRIAARNALAHFGVTGPSILINPDKSPSFPEGWIGSIAHTNSKAIAVVSNNPIILSVGVDIEEVGQIDASLFPILSSPAELAILNSLSNSSAIELSETFFTIKEAYYKAQFMLTGEWLDFLDVEVQKSDKGYSINLINLGKNQICNNLVKVVNCIRTKHLCVSYVLIFDYGVSTDDLSSISNSSFTS